MGFVYNAEGQLVIDPDEQVQQSVRVLFETFQRTGSAMATVKFFAEQGLLFPRRCPYWNKQGRHRVGRT
jgi:hypothetical protein